MALLDALFGDQLLIRQLNDRLAGQALDEILETRDQCFDRGVGRTLDRALEPPPVDPEAAVDRSFLN